MNDIEQQAQRYIEQQWENLPTELGAIDAGENIDRLAAILLEALDGDEARELRDKLIELLGG